MNNHKKQTKDAKKLREENAICGKQVNNIFLKVQESLDQQEMEKGKQKPFKNIIYT